MRDVVLIHGTWSRQAPWYQPGSALWAALSPRGCPLLAFKWSGYCGGIPSPVIVPPSSRELKGSLELWRSEGEKLHLFCRAASLEAPHAICHSHGLQLVAFAADGGQRFGTVISLSGPVREDMAWTRQRARGNIETWIHVVDPSGGDRRIGEGEAFDGEVGWHYDLPEADVNVHVPGQGHSGMTTDLAAWDQADLWRYLT